MILGLSRMTLSGQGGLKCELEALCQASVTRVVSYWQLEQLAPPMVDTGDHGSRCDG